MAGRSGRVRQGYKPRARWLRAHRRMGVGPAPEAAVQPGHRALQVRRAVRYGLHRRHARRGRAQSAPPQRRAARRRGIHPRGAAQAPDQGEILGGSRADATGPPAARRRVRRPPQGAGDLSQARRRRQVRRARRADRAPRRRQQAPRRLHVRALGRRGGRSRVPVSLRHVPTRGPPVKARQARRVAHVQSGTHRRVGRVRGGAGEGVEGRDGRRVGLRVRRRGRRRRRNRRPKFRFFRRARRPQSQVLPPLRPREGVRATREARTGAARLSRGAVVRAELERVGTLRRRRGDAAPIARPGGGARARAHHGDGA